MFSESSAYKAFKRHINGTQEMDIELEDYARDNNYGGIERRFSDGWMLEMGDREWAEKGIELRDALTAELAAAAE